MRRGRGLFLIAACAIAVTCGYATAARADNGGGSPMAICHDLQDGKLDGTYTQAQWNAFERDPTVQGYCNVVVPPCAYPGGGNSGSNGGTSCTQPTSSKNAGIAPTNMGKKPATPTAVASLNTARKGTLPFTGAQLILFVLVGAGLVATGFVLRATGRRKPEA